MTVVLDNTIDLISITIPIGTSSSINCRLVHFWHQNNKTATHSNNLQTLLGIAQPYVEGKTTDLVGPQQIVYKNLFS